MNLTWIILFVAIFHSIRINEFAFFPLFFSKINEMPSSHVSCAQSSMCEFASACVCGKCYNIAGDQLTRLNEKKNTNLFDGALSIVRYQASWHGDMNKTVQFL